MLTEIQITRYRRLRAEGVKARNAYKAASSWPGPVEFLFDYQDAICFVHEGFDIRVQVGRDHFADRSYVGTFSSEWAPGAVRHSANEPATWFRPTVCASEHYAALQMQGYSKQEALVLAQRYVREDLLLAEGFAYPHYVVLVAASRAEVQLGFNKITGVCISQYEPTGQEVVDYVFAEGIVSDVVASARATLAKLLS